MAPQLKKSITIDPDDSLVIAKTIPKTKDSANVTFQKRERKEVKSRHGSGPSSYFIHCNSDGQYESYPRNLKNSKEVNDTLNLHLGLPFNPMEIYPIRLWCQALSFLLSFVEKFFFNLFGIVPLQIRQRVIATFWKLYLPIHIVTLSDTTGIHKNASYEYHALSTIMYWTRLFPMTTSRMRFGLSQLSVCHGADVYPTLDKHVNKREEVYHDGKMDNFGLVLSNLSVRGSNDYPPPVTGIYVYHNPSREKKSKKVLLYLYGGAFISGDCEGSLPFAKKLSQQIGADLFLPSYRLGPENTFSDALEDVIRAYVYLVGVRGIDPDNVVLFGNSSGGGLAMRLLQRLNEIRNEAIIVDHHSARARNANMPSCAVLMCPFVDFTNPKGSLLHYPAHDLIVNQATVEEVMHHSKSILGDEQARFEESPINRQLHGLPPLCVVVSEHECCYDQAIDLCNKARKAGVKVDLGVWKYMCHVWPLLSLFLPEARSAIDFMCQWISDASIKDKERSLHRDHRLRIENE